MFGRAREQAPGAGREVSRGAAPRASSAQAERQRARACHISDSLRGQVSAPQANVCNHLVACTAN